EAKITLDWLKDRCSRKEPLLYPWAKMSQNPIVGEAKFRERASHRDTVFQSPRSLTLLPRRRIFHQPVTKDDEKMDVPQYAPEACEQKVKYQKANDANRNENDAEQNDQFHGCQRQHHYAALEK